jgi:hypothetical protein
LDIREKMPWLAPQAPGESWHYFSSAQDTLISSVNDVSGELAAAIDAFAGGGDASALESSVLEVQSRLAGMVLAAPRANRLTAGEDEVFGRRAATCGHPTFVDFSVVCGHVGGKIYGI